MGRACSGNGFGSQEHKDGKTLNFAGIASLAFVIILAAEGSGIGGPSGAAPDRPDSRSNPPIVTIRIVTDAQDRCDKAYDPSIITIKAGTTVAWINQDYETHTLVSSQGEDPCKQTELPPETRLIDVGQLPPHKEYRKTFTKPGEYHYMCHLPFHHMGGEIIVVP